MCVCARVCLGIEYLTCSGPKMKKVGCRCTMLCAVPLCIFLYVYVYNFRKLLTLRGMYLCLNIEHLVYPK